MGVSVRVKREIHADIKGRRGSVACLYQHCPGPYYSLHIAVSLNKTSFLRRTAVHSLHSRWPWCCSAPVCMWASMCLYVCKEAAPLRWPCFHSIGAFTRQELSPCKEWDCAGASLSLSFLCRRLFSFILSLFLSLCSSSLSTSSCRHWIPPPPHTQTLKMDIHRYKLGQYRAHVPRLPSTYMHLLKCLEFLIVSAFFSPYCCVFM